jgi:hypothetical protein
MPISSLTEYIHIPIICSYLGQVFSLSIQISIPGIYILVRNRTSLTNKHIFLSPVMWFIFNLPPGGEYWPMSFGGKNMKRVREKGGKCKRKRKKEERKRKKGEENEKRGRKEVK